MHVNKDHEQEIAERVGIAKDFRKFDTDDSGKLERQEFEKDMVLVGMRLTPGELNEMWNETDTDGSGVIDLQEFAALVKVRRGQNTHTVESRQDKAIAEAFRKFDTDDSGKLER